MTEGGASLPSGIDDQEGMNFVIKYEPANMIEIFENS